MRIGIDISQIVYQTGVSRYTAELVKNLLKIDRENEYYFYAGSCHQRQFLQDFFDQIKTNKTTLKLNWITPKLADIFWNKLNLFTPTDIDIFHASNWSLPKTKSKLITTIHDLAFLKYPKTLPPYLVAVHTNYLQRAKKYADRIITVSQSTKKDLVNYGISEAKISVIYEAASPIFKPVNPSVTKTKYGLAKPYFLSVGTLEPRKNITRLIKAYLSIKTDLQLIIVGKFGWGETYDNHSGIKFIGFVPDEDLVGLYSGAKAFIYPSLYEGFGLPVLEALSCGCSVITSNCSSLPEVGGKAALYVDPENINSISQAMTAVLKLNLREKSLKQAKQFSWEKTARETLKVYQEVVKC